MDRRWLQLLVFFNNKSYARTFPFLIGALRGPPGYVVKDAKLCFEELKKLLCAIESETQNPYRVRISRCADIHQPVIGVDTYMYSPPASDNCLSDNVSIATGISGDRNAKLESIAEQIWDEIKSPVIAGHFSFHKKDLSYHPFGDNELSQIEAAFATRIEFEV